MKLFLVRHGQTNHNRERILQGQLDTELSELGKEQAKKVSERLKDHYFTKIFSSDLQRASFTAKEIAKHHETEIIYDERLREKKYGDFTGKKSLSVDWSKIPGKPCDQRPPNGESPRDHAIRVKDFIDNLEGEGNILLVSHGGTIKALLHVLLGRDMDDLLFNVKPKNTCVYIIEKKGDEYIPILENCDIHLSEE